MAETAADVLMETLHDCGVEVIFGLPGDSINGLIEALRRCQDTIRFIQVRHEEAAAAGQGDPGAGDEARRSIGTGGA